MFDERLKSLLLAALGCIFVGLFFWIVSESKTLELLNTDLTKDDILQIADRVYQKSPLAEYDMTREFSLKLDHDLLNYCQKTAVKASEGSFLPVGSWQVTWRGQIETKKEEPQEALLSLRYGLSGNLLELSQAGPHLSRRVNYKEEEAMEEAMRFLVRQNMDTTGLELTNRASSQEDRVKIYDFVFSKPSRITDDLREVYEVNIRGRNVANYRARVIVDDQAFFSQLDRTSRTLSIITMIGTWLVIGIFAIVTFIQKLRRDELEFKRALLLAVLTLAVLWGFIAITAWPDWEGVLIGGGMLGLLTGLGTLVTYSSAESLSREVWPEKLALLDVLSRGLFRVKEFGKTILDTLFITGISLLIFGIVIWLIGSSGIGYISFGGAVLWIFESTASAVSALLRNLATSLFFGLLLFAFWNTYLKSKIKSEITLIALLSVFINLAGLQLFYVRPEYLAFVFFMPLALLWAYFSLRVNILSLLLAFFCVNLFFELSLLSLKPGGLLSAPGVLVYSGLFILFIIGAVAVYSRVSVHDFEYYVPEYVGRIAEQERFLKELEIARNVQMRFLPQTHPIFPGLEIASICRPAREVGGDYYDFISNGDGSLGIVIGDVSGKGVSAAFYMTMAKGIIKTLCKSITTPKKILEEMNSIFYENVPRDIFISVIFGVFDLKNRVLRFARAGHNPLIVKKSSSSNLDIMYPKGIAIGLEKGQLFSQTIEEQTISLDNDDVFVFFTDGISESMNRHGAEFGEDNLRKVIQTCNNSSAQNILDRINAEVRKFTGTAKQHDDFTMVVVRIHA